MTDDARDFYLLVKEMREAQRRWFRSRGTDTAALERAKETERQCDQVLKAYFEQRTLF